MVLFEYLIIQGLLIVWFINTIKIYPKKDSAFSYRVLAGNIGIIVIISGVAIYLLVKGESFIGYFIGLFSK